MQCPYCDEDSNVTETRVIAEGLRRRRVCTNCKRRFTTYERVGAPGLQVLKRNGRREAFSADKLKAALARIAKGRNTLPPETLARIVRDLEAQLIDERHRVVSWHELIRLTLSRLAPLDALATLRLRANYVDEHDELRFEASGAPSDEPQLPLPGVEDA